MQPVPEGYKPLGFAGFTDKGGYSESEVYAENDLVHFGSTIWRCLANNTTNVEPGEDSEAWEIFIELNDPYYGPYDSFPKPPDQKDKLKLYIDDTTEDYRIIYTWSDQENNYVITGGAGGSGSGSVDIPITLTSAGWTGTAAPYQQTITVPQMREKMRPFFFLDTEGDAALYAYSLITGYSAGYAEITFYAADKPTIDLSLTLKGIPAQEMEYVDNTVVFLVEPSAFALNSTTQRYEATITVPGMTAGTGGTWDIVRSGPDLTTAESKIALSITDVDRLEGSVKITCLELPEQRYMMSIAGAYPDAEPGTVILAGMQEWFDRVEALEEKARISTGTCIKVSEKVTMGDGANKWQKAAGICTVQYDFSVNQILSGVNDIFKGLPAPKENYWMKLCADTSIGETSVDALVLIKTVGNEGYISSNWRDVKAGRYMGTMMYMTAV